MQTPCRKRVDPAAAAAAAIVDVNASAKRRETTAAQPRGVTRALGRVTFQRMTGWGCAINRTARVLCRASYRQNEYATDCGRSYTNYRVSQNKRTSGSLSFFGATTV